MRIGEVCEELECVGDQWVGIGINGMGSEEWRREKNVSCRKKQNSQTIIP